MSRSDDGRSFLKNHNWRIWADPAHETDGRNGMPLLPPEKLYPEDAKLIDLVTADRLTVGNMSVRDAFAARKSRRKYTNDPLTLEELSFLLWATQGVRKTSEFPVGTLTFRTVPSGGSFHSFETYLAIDRVEGLKSGLYRYLPMEHKLLFIRADADLMQKIASANVGNEFVRDSAVFFIWTTIPYRMEYQYDIVAHKIIAVDAGHLCQNLYIAGESIGAGVCAILGFYQEDMDAVLGVDGTDEFAIYAASVGRAEQ